MTTSYNKDLSKPWNQTVPKSMQGGGTNLDIGCGDIEQADAGVSLDHAAKLIEGTKRK
jgi:hypothetical protein